jgi:hypothetical protein
MFMRKKGLIAAFALIAAGAFAQTADVLDRLLAEGALSFAQASRFILSSAGTVSPDLSEEECFALALERGWIDSTVDPSRKIRLDEFSYLTMLAFELKGGYLYRFFPGRRYAYREFTYKKFIQGRGDPAQRVSGIRAVYIIGRVLDAKGESL